MTLLVFISLLFFALLVLAVATHLSTRRYQGLQALLWFFAGLVAMVATGLYVLTGEYPTAAMAFALYAITFFVGFKKIGQSNNTGAILHR